MGYDVQVTRADHWSRNVDAEITFREWKGLVDADPELTIDYIARLDGDDWGRLLQLYPALEACRTPEGALHFDPGEFQAMGVAEKARLLKQEEDVDLDCDTATWSSHPRRDPCEFTFLRGNIVATNPDLAAMAKLCRLAEALGGKVQGEDGEVYRYTEAGLDCFEPGRGWQPFDLYHKGKPHWASLIAREIARGKKRRRG